MSMILKDGRLAFQFGRTTAQRQTCETVEQLQQQNAELKRQLAAECAQHVFDMEQQHKEIIKLLRDNAEQRLDIIRRDREAAFAACSSPSASVH